MVNIFLLGVEFNVNSTNIKCFWIKLVMLSAVDGFERYIQMPFSLLQVKRGTHVSAQENQQLIT